MRVVRLRSGGHVSVFPDNELWPIDGGICFSEEEYSFAQKLAASLNSDPEQLKSFWEELLERKKNNSYYSLFTDFPKHPPIELSDKAMMAKKYCEETLRMLRSKGHETKVRE